MKQTFLIGALLVAVGVIGLLTAFNGNQDWLSFGTKEIHKVKEEAAAGLSHVRIQSSSLNAEVVRGAGDKVVVTVNGKLSSRFEDKLTFETDTNGETLTVKADMKSGFSIGFNIIDLRVRVELPEQLWENVSVDVSSGNIKLEELAAAAISAKTSSGNITIEDVKGETLHAETKSGNHRIKGTNVKQYRIQAGSGNITAENWIGESFEFRVSSGNVKLYDGSAAVNGSASSGNIVYETSKLTQETRLQAGSGNVTVRVSEQPADLELLLRAGSGNVKTDFKSGLTSSVVMEKEISGRFGGGGALLEARTGSGNISFVRR